MGFLSSILDSPALPHWTVCVNLYQLSNIYPHDSTGECQRIVAYNMTCGLYCMHNSFLVSMLNLFLCFFSFFLTKYFNLSNRKQLSFQFSYFPVAVHSMASVSPWTGITADLGALEFIAFSYFITDVLKTQNIWHVFSPSFRLKCCFPLSFNFITLWWVEQCWFTVGCIKF